MKRNINLMQSNIDLNEEFINQVSKEYILQALANLGQRLGIKGDGLSYKSFNFLNLINDNNNIYSPDDYIGYLEYSNNTAIFGLNNISNNTDIVLNNLFNTKSINNNLYANREFSFTIPVNAIDKYSKNSIISNNDNILTVITVGKKIGYEDNDNNNAVLLYYKFNTLNNSLIYSIKSGYIGSNNGNDYYYLLKLNHKLDSNNLELNKEYVLTLKIFNVNSLIFDNDDTTYKEMFINTYCYENHNTLTDVPIFELLNNEFIDINNVEEYNDDKQYNYSANSPFSIILNNIGNESIYTGNSVNLVLDTTSNQFLWHIDNETTYEEYISLYKNEYDFLNIEEEIYFLNNDITDFFENILRYYNEKYYIENKSTYFYRILCLIYEKISYDLLKEDSSFDKTKFRLYIPLEYNINYICNSNNELDIYYSNDMYILLTDVSKVYNRKEILNNSDYLIFNYEGVDKVKSYKFEVEYNNYITDLINKVSIKNIYTMPYVGFNENWNINNNDTNIRAVGKDAGNPNIIIINSIDDENYKILSAISKNKDISNIKFEYIEFKLRNNLFANVLNVSNPKCNAWIPIIDKTNYEIFENSILINISSLSCLSNQKYKDYYLGSNVITIWNYSITNNGYEFEVVTDSEGYVIPLGVTTNLDSILANTTLLNLNEQELLILKARLINEIGQNSINNTEYNWGIIKNKNSTEYNPNAINYNTYDESFKYHNNLNAIIEYTDNLKLTKNNVEYSNLSKYVPYINSPSTNTEVTNILYPKYESSIKTEIQTIEETIYEIRQGLETAESQILTIDGDTYTVINEIYDIITNKLERITDEVEHEYSIKQINKVVDNINGVDVNVNYNEYLFNSNVPNIDFKEIFLRNVNTLNRYNIITLDKNGSAYYSYLGSNYDEDDKSILHLGSLNKNINIGTDTLMNQSDVDEFKVHDGVSIDFDNIKFNAHTTISYANIPFVNKVINNKEYCATSYYILDALSKNIITDVDTNNTIKEQLIYNNLHNAIKVNNNMFFNNYDNLNITYYNDEDAGNKKIYFIYLNNIIKDIFNIELTKDNFNDITISCGKNKLFILTKETNGVILDIPKFFLMVNDELIQSINNNTIWSTDVLDLLLTKENQQIKIICKYNKYNLESGNNVTVNYKLGRLIGLDYETETDTNPVVLEDVYGYWYIGRDYLEEQLHTTSLPEIINPTENLVDDNSNPGWRIIPEMFNMYNEGGLEHIYENENIHILFSVTDSITIILPKGFDAVDQFNSSLIASNIIDEITIGDIEYNVYEIYAMEFAPYKIIYTIV